MGHSPGISMRGAALATSVAVALLAGVAHAKPWKKWAPGPLDSDSTYAVFLTRPSDSLTAAQLSWLAVQRDWRAQRDAEAEPPSMSITDPRPQHRSRPGDRRFAALVSRPYEALADSDRAWLVAENAAQRVARESHGRAGGVIVISFLTVIVGIVVAIVVVATSATARPGLLL
jgi:hypothetical protein